MTRPMIAFPFILLLCLSLLSSACSNKHDGPAPLAPAPISDMVVTLVTRTGATNPAYSEALKESAGSSAAAFRSSLGDDHALNRFADELPPVLSIFQAQYSAATTSFSKADALDRLFNGILQAAHQAGISGEQLELAMLSAFADLQAKLTLPPFSTSFSDADRELVNLLMTATVNQLHLRTTFNEGRSATINLGVISDLSDRYLKATDLFDSNMMILFSSLENRIANTAVLADSSALVVEHWNNLAQYDILLFAYHLEQSDLFNPMWVTAMDQIIYRMDAVGGIMSGMTITNLLSSGMATGTQPYWSSKEYFVYDWVRTGMSLYYDPSTILASQVIQLGGTVPASPDFSYFSNPYLAVFRLKYDFDLANLIDDLEWNQSTATITSPLAMQDWHTLRMAQYSRRRQILSRFTGATDAEKAAIAAFFASPH